MFVVVADSLQLAAPGELSDDKLQTSPQTFTVEENEELGDNSAEEETGGVRLQIIYSLLFEKN